MSLVNDKLMHERERVRTIWRVNCGQLRLFDEECERHAEESAMKDTEIEFLRRQLEDLKRVLPGTTERDRRVLTVPTTLPEPVVERRVVPLLEDISMHVSGGMTTSHTFPVSVVTTPHTLPGIVASAGPGSLRVSSAVPTLGEPGTGRLIATVARDDHTALSIRTSPTEPDTIPISLMSGPIPAPIVSGTAPVPAVSSTSPVYRSATALTSVPCVTSSATSSTESSHEGLAAVNSIVSELPPNPSLPVCRQGKAPPVDSFMGERPEVRFEDWVPTLDRTAVWNGWSKEECLMKLAGHLRGKALQEWNLLSESDRETYESATGELRKRLDPENRIMAVQDFRHAVQREAESVADYLRRLERCFQLAYGRDHLKTETKETMLFSQLQEGLRFDLFKSPSVSGCQAYRELCVAAKQKERIIAEMRRRQQYQQGKGIQARSQDSKRVPDKGRSSLPAAKAQEGDQQTKPVRKCYTCSSPDHLARACKVRSRESTSSSNSVNNWKSGTVKAKVSQVTSETTGGLEEREDPADYLYSSSESESEITVRLVRVTYEGSSARRALVEVQGVPAYGVIDSGSDITVMDPDLFKTIAAATRMKRRCLKPVDKVPYTFDHKTFHLDG